MGIGGNFWDILKPYARYEGFDFLRDKKVAVDLSFWIVQHETAIRNAGRARNPHIRITFFRTINLFAKMGAFPVFVVDGEPSPLKDRARMERFCRANGLELDSPRRFKTLDGGISVRRNRAFTKCVEECVELLQYLGMPILRARGEAEALCAQLNSEGHVDACITADSDALLYGAKCVIKSLQSNSKEPFECYNMSDIEAGLGLKRKQLIAISMLVGNDHDLNGVSGIGVDTAIHFVRLFNENEVLDRLCDFGNGNSVLEDNKKSSMGSNIPIPNDDSSLKRSPHCSNCGHPGSKKNHLKMACDYCIADGDENCTSMPAGFKCECSNCHKGHRNKEQKKHDSWQLKVHKRISKERNFPNTEIIEMYLSDSYRDCNENFLTLSWEKLQMDALVDFLAYHQNWEPSYTRQRLLPMLSTVFLREMASDPKEDLLLCGQYEFHSIHRVKTRYKCTYFVVKWKRAMPTMIGAADHVSSEQLDYSQREASVVGENETCEVSENKVCEFSENNALLDEEPDLPEVLTDEGYCFLVTDEYAGLVEAAFPKEVDKFLCDKKIKETSSKRRKSYVDDKLQETPKSTGVQLSITQFYRSSKVLGPLIPDDDPLKLSKTHSSGKRGKAPEDPDRNTSKSVRRRLLFG